MAAENTGFLQQDARRGQDGTKIAASELVTTIRSRQGPSLDNREAGRSQPETTQILVANQTQRCRSKERARPKDQHAKRPEKDGTSRFYQADKHIYGSGY